MKRDFQKERDALESAFSRMAERVQRQKAERDRKTARRRQRLVKLALRHVEVI